MYTCNEEVKNVKASFVDLEQRHLSIVSSATPGPEIMFWK